MKAIIYLRKVPQMTERINNFISNIVAFYRPIKRTYYFLIWNTTTREWGAYDTDHENITLHKSTAHIRNGNVDIHIRLGRRRHIVPIVSDRCFLRSGNTYIPILKQIGNALPGIQKLRQYTATHDIATYNMDTQLWTVLPLPVIAPIIATPSPALSQLNKGIPQRIAWLIAEDACKKNDICPITQEEISPLTSSVTTCFHVFNTEAIALWAARQTVTELPCPVCRTPCKTTIAYEETS
jgi:hypothetical protein